MDFRDYSVYKIMRLITYLPTDLVPAILFRGIEGCLLP
jgi:hypothetical protein